MGNCNGMDDRTHTAKVRANLNSQTAAVKPLSLAKQLEPFHRSTHASSPSRVALSVDALSKPLSSTPTDQDVLMQQSKCTAADDCCTQQTRHRWSCLTRRDQCFARPLDFRAITAAFAKTVRKLASSDHWKTLTSAQTRYCVAVRCVDDCVLPVPRARSTLIRRLTTF
jgi:hypothetical protein